jgi:hypothetical protein
MRWLNLSNPYKISIFLLCLPFILYLDAFNCAHKVAPTGGPEDKTAPTVVKYFPANDSTGIESLEYIEVEFSEPIRKNSLSNNFWIIPELENKFKIKWKGSKKVRFYFVDSLEVDQTYVFILGTGIKDMRNNGLSEPFQIAFASGDVLDAGSISGKVYADRPESGVFIFAYPIFAGIDIDSLLLDKARYYSQIDAEGNYRLRYLAMGRYRLIALLDKDYNSIYNIESDFIGLPFQDIELDSLHPIFTNMHFYLIEEDTTPPRLSSIDTVSSRELLVSFTEEVRSEKTTYQVIDSLTGQEYPVINTSVRSTEKDNVSLFFEQLPPQQDLLLSIIGLSDLSGNFIKEGRISEKFATAIQTDTLRPEFSGMDPTSGSINVPFNKWLALKFNSPIDTPSLKNTFQLQSETGDSVAGRFDFNNLREPVFIPNQPLMNNANYIIKLKLHNLKSLWGDEFPDTTISSTFSTTNLGDLGEISGQIIAGDLAWKSAIVEAKPLQGKVLYQDIAKIGAEYQIDHLPAGLYLMKLIIDLNENGQWDKGRSFPWQFSEPFIFRGDTVNVRKRWTSKGIDFYFNFGDR